MAFPSLIDVNLKHIYKNHCNTVGYNLILHLTKQIGKPLLRRSQANADESILYPVCL